MDAPEVDFGTMRTVKIFLLRTLDVATYTFVTGSIDIRNLLKSTRFSDFGKEVMV